MALGRKKKEEEEQYDYAKYLTLSPEQEAEEEYAGLRAGVYDSTNIAMAAAQGPEDIFSALSGLVGSFSSQDTTTTGLPTEQETFDALGRIQNEFFGKDMQYPALGLDYTPEDEEREPSEGGIGAVAGQVGKVGGNILLELGRMFAPNIVNPIEDVLSTSGVIQPNIRNPIARRRYRAMQKEAINTVEQKRKSFGGSAMIQYAMASWQGGQRADIASRMQMNQYKRDQAKEWASLIVYDAYVNGLDSVAPESKRWASAVLGQPIDAVIKQLQYNEDMMPRNKKDLDARTAGAKQRTLLEWISFKLGGSQFLNDQLMILAAVPEAMRAGYMPTFFEALRTINPNSHLFSMPPHEAAAEVSRYADMMTDYNSQINAKIAPLLQERRRSITVLRGKNMDTMLAEMITPTIADMMGVFRAELSFMDSPAARASEAQLRAQPYNKMAQRYINHIDQQRAAYITAIRKLMTETDPDEQLKLINAGLGYLNWVSVADEAIVPTVTPYGQPAMQPAAQPALPAGQAQVKGQAEAAIRGVGISDDIAAYRRNLEKSIPADKLSAFRTEARDALTKEELDVIYKKYVSGD